MFWLTSRRRVRSRGRLSLCAFLIGLACSFGISAPAAHAGTDYFCSGQNVPSGSVCWGPSHSLTAVRGTNNTSGSGCGGARDYGSFYCATPAGCHTYAGIFQLYPGVRHRSSTSKNMSGYSTWGSTGPPTNCVTGTPYAVAGAVTSSPAYVEGVPVLERDAAVAPAEVASLVPGADPAAARRFDTPHGAAWVMLDMTTRLVCVVADDAGAGYGTSCQRLGEARSLGSLSTFEDADTTTAAGDVVIALTPEDVDAVEVTRADGTTRELPAQGGVVVTTLGPKDRAVTMDPAPEAEGQVAQRLVMARR